MKARPLDGHFTALKVVALQKGVEMSVELLGAVLRNAKYHANKKMVLVVLADFADEEGFCWPDVNTLADRSCTSISTVQRAIKEFVKDGWLVVDVRPRTGVGRWGSNGYQFTRQVTQTSGHGDLRSRQVTARMGESEPSMNETPLPPFTDEGQNHHSHPPLNRTEVTPSPKPPPQPRTAKQRAKSKQHQTGRAHPTPSPTSAATPSPPLSKRDQTALYMEEQLARLDDI